MLQAVDSAAAPAADARRQRWLRVLARAPVSQLAQALANVPRDGITWLRPAEVGLMMVRARVGGTGDRFNLGEMTVTRCAVRVVEPGGEVLVGIGHVRGRSLRQAELVALADALMQSPMHAAQLQQELLNPVEQTLAADDARRARQAQATRVEFFTVARESAA